MHALPPPVRDLILVGGGHAHVQVLRALVAHPVPGVRVTLIAREPASPYSGMLPGHIAGLYRREEMHIDLVPLCRAAAVRLLVAEVSGLDPDAGWLHVTGRPPLRFDWLSLNTGAVPRQPDGGVAVKPIGLFLPQWDEARHDLPPGAPVWVVGAGAGGVELAFGMHAARPDLAIGIVGREWLPGFSNRARSLLRAAARTQGIEVMAGTGVARVSGMLMELEDGRTLPAARTFWVTDVHAPAWLAASGLSTDARGFVNVGPTLQSVSHPRIFAAGDVACLVDQERPKSGVYAVRAGPVLAHNLRAVVSGAALRAFTPQRNFLRLIGTGDGRAVAAKWSLAWAGGLMWRWKDRIDRRFMAMFRMPAMLSADSPVPLPAPLQADVPEAMRCGGCGAKLGADLLRRVLDRLPIRPRPQVRLGIGDDAAEVSADGSVLITTDGLRAMIDDPYLFGRIVTHHNLNDLFAMGARPTSAVALVTVPLMGEALMESELTAVLRGVVDVLEAHDVPLVGGHSAEGAELFLGLTVTGRRGPVTLTKDGLQAGQKLVLTRAIGTGIILAAAMRGLPVAAELSAAVGVMDASNAACVDILVAHGATGATDVTGFGLLGHLAEMLRAGGCGAVVDVAAVPVLAGAQALLGQGVHSALQHNNQQVLADFVTAAGVDARLLCDPQTSGGLLAGIPAAQVQACIEALHAAGYRDACAIGEVTQDRWQLR